MVSRANGLRGEWFKGRMVSRGELKRGANGFTARIPCHLLSTVYVGIHDIGRESRRLSQTKLSPSTHAHPPYTYYFVEVYVSITGAPRPAAAPEASPLACATAEDSSEDSAYSRSAVAATTPAASRALLREPPPPPRTPPCGGRRRARGRPPAAARRAGSAARPAAIPSRGVPAPRCSGTSCV
jgi:hypothetical protein